MIGEWNSLYSGLKPKNLLGHGKVVRPGLYAKGKAQRVINHEREWNWVIPSVADKMSDTGNQSLLKRKGVNLPEAQSTDNPCMIPRRRWEPHETSRMHKKSEDFYLCINKGILT